MKKLFTLFLVLLSIDPAWATTYYVANSGNDSSNGTFVSPFVNAPGTPACGATCAGVTLVAGDHVRFKCGDSFRNLPVTLSSSGTASQRILYGAYGACTPSTLPKLYGSTGVTSWSQVGTTVVFGAGTSDAADVNTMGTNVTTNYNSGFDTAGKRMWIYNSGAGVLGFGLFRWDISSLTGKTITAATFSVWYDNLGGTPLTTTVYNLTGTPGTAWVDSTATYSKYDGTNAWTGGANGGLGNIGSAMSSNTTVPGAIGQWIDFPFNATGLSYVQGQTAGAVNFLLRITASAGGNNELIIPSAEYTTTPGHRPKLTISYNNPASTVYSSSVASAVATLFYDGTRLVQDTGTPTSPALNKWGYSGSTLYLNVGGDPTGHSVEVLTSASPNDAFDIGNDTQALAKNYVTVDSLDIEYVKRWFIWAGNTTGTTVTKNTIQHSGPGDGSNDPVGVALNHNSSFGVVCGNKINDIRDQTVAPNLGAGVYIGTVFNSGTTYRPHDHLLCNNEISNVKDGFSVKYGATLNIFRANYVHDVAQVCIRIVGYDDSGNTIEGNKLKECLEAGIHTYSYSLIRHNHIINAGESGTVGIFINGQSTTTENNFPSGRFNQLLNNTLSNSERNIHFNNGTANANPTVSNTVKNNLVREGTRAIGFQSTPPNPTPNDIDWNIYFKVASMANYFTYGTTTDFAGWKTNTGADAHSLNVDPLLKNPGTDDFTLLVGSPAIRAGLNLGSAHQFALNPNTSFPYGLYSQNLAGGWSMGAFAFVPSSPSVVTCLPSPANASRLTDGGYTEGGSSELGYCPTN